MTESATETCLSLTRVNICAFSSVHVAFSFCAKNTSSLVIPYTGAGTQYTTEVQIYVLDFLAE